MDKRKSIIISTYDDILNPHYGGGGAISIHEVAKRLQKNFQVSVISWNHSGISHQIVEGVEYHRIGIHRLPPKLGMLCFQLMLPFLVRLKKYDLWLESFSPPFTTAFLPLFTKKTIVGVIHMLAAVDMYRKYHINLSSLETIGLKKYKYLITTQELLQKKIIKLNSRSLCTVISNGVYMPRRISQKRLTQIVFLGRIEINQKGLDLLIESFAKLLRLGHLQYRLIIAGTGLPYEKLKLKRLILNSGLQDYITQIGKVTGSMKDQILKNSSIMVIPSRFETFSMSALEGLAYGLPIISFEIEGLNWLPSSASIKVRAFDTSSFANALESIITQSTRIEKMRESGRLFATNYSWERIGNAYAEYLKPLIYA